MESNQHTRSVIAQLMGFDELPIQQSAYKPYLGLSESYLQKSASIGLIEKRSSFKAPVLTANCQKKQEPLNLCGVPDLPTTIHAIQGGKANSRTNAKDWHPKEFDEVMEELDSEDDNLPRHFHLPDYSFAKDLCDLQFGQLNSLSGNGKAISSASTPYNRNVEIFRKSERTIAKWNLFRSLKNLEGGSVTDFSDGRKLQNYEVGCPLPKDNESRIGGVKRNLTDGSEPKCCNMKASRTVSRGNGTSGNKPDQETRSRILKHEIGLRDFSLISEESSSISSDVAENRNKQDIGVLIELESPLIQSHASSPSSKAVAGENLGSLSKTSKDKEFHSVICKMFVEDRYPDILDYSARQEPSAFSPREGLVSLSCSNIDSECPMKYRESHSASPDSVLEPAFGDNILYGSRRFGGVSTNLDGLRMQLQLLESEETDTEALGMVVSSDEESGEGSVDLSSESIKLLGSSRAEDSRDYSYLVDVLDEAGFHSSKLHLGFFHEWSSSDYPVNPLVFEILEKKYGEQASWEKSERKLLFERMNSGLKHILQPCMDILSWEKPLRKNFNLSQSREVIEEELWRFLVSQEKEARKSLPEKVLAADCRWLEMRDEIEGIVCEIEKSLFEELATELASFQ